MKEKNYSDLFDTNNPPPSKVTQQSDTDASAGTKWYDSKTELAFRRDVLSGRSTKCDSKSAREKKLVQTYSNFGRVFPSPTPIVDGISTAAAVYEKDAHLQRRNSESFEAQQVCVHGGNAFEDKLEIRRSQRRALDLTSERLSGCKQVGCTNAAASFNTDTSTSIIIATGSKIDHANPEGAKERKMKQMMGSGVVQSFGDKQYTSSHRERNVDNFSVKRDDPTHGYSRTLSNAQGTLGIAPQHEVTPNAERLSRIQVKLDAVESLGPGSSLSSTVRKACDLQGQIDYRNM